MSSYKKVLFKNSFEEDNFVGLKYDKENISVYLPLGYDKDYFDHDVELSSNQKVDLLLLMKSINLVKSLTDEMSDFGDNIGNNNEIPYNSFLWIIDDYFNNGLYQEIEKKYIQRSNGKINWKRTLNSEHYFSNNNVIYINPYYESSFRKNNLITELNNYCLHQSVKYVGFLFGNIVLPKCELSENNILSNCKYYIDLINKELAKSFNDRKKMLLINMKRILKMSYDNAFENQTNFGTRKYEYAWEKMINESLGSKIDISKYFPNAYWNINGKRDEDKSKLRPDSIYKDKINKKLYILDAKYYKYGITGKISDLPHTDSIQKQITYGDYISNNKNIYGIDKNNIYNAFILPFNKNKEPFVSNNNIKYIGYANSAWRNKEVEYTYERISLLLIDMKYVLDCYFHKEKADLKKLVELIEKSTFEK